MNIRWGRSLLCGLVMAWTACAPAVHTIAYVPQPQRIENPDKTLATLIVANTVQGCVVSPAFNEGIFVVQFVCTTGAGNYVIRPSQIASIELQQQGPWYRVRVRHSGGAVDFVWDSKSLTDAQHIADAIAGLAAPAPAPAPAPQAV